MRILFVLISALWFGGGAALMFIAAPAAFAVAPDRATAANVVGAILTRWHYLALVAPLVLLASDFRRGLPNNTRVIVLALSIFFAVAQVAVDTRIRSIRAASPVAISELPKSDATRRTFGMLHGVSTLLMLLQVIGAGATLTTLTRE